jgi:DNA-binding NarL/FixJ family response regulator
MWSRSLSLEAVAVAPDGLETIDCTGHIRLVLVNLGGSSIDDQRVQDLLLRIKEMFRDIPCAILSDRREPEEAISAADLGVQAFLTTDMQPDLARQALAFVVGGGTYFPREALLASGHSASHSPNADTKSDLSYGGLTPRQHEVLDRLRFGKSNKQIARELNMQEATVKVHVRQIMRKLGAANRTQAALLAQPLQRSTTATMSLGAAH